MASRFRLKVVHPQCEVEGLTAAFASKDCNLIQRLLAEATADTELLVESVESNLFVTHPTRYIKEELETFFVVKADAAGKKQKPGVSAINHSSTTTVIVELTLQPHTPPLKERGSAKAWVERLVSLHMP